MPVVPVDELSDPRLADYRHVPDPELLRRGEVFVAEGRLVVRTLLSDSPFVTRSLLVTETAFDALRDVIEPRLAQLQIYLVGQERIKELTGFNIHRGCLAIGERPAPVRLETCLPGLVGADAAGPLIVLEQIVNADNVGGIFRNAAAFGASAVVLGPNCCDPLYRKAIRTSMGAALRVRFVHAGEWPGALARLREAAFTVVALTPRAGAMSIEEFARDAETGRTGPIALLAGSEGPGLSAAALAAADVAVCIPMASGVDSLNVATAVAIALHRLTEARSTGL
jgi:tRNA G18 (ribose-2'-O)-methylase SpoU